MGKPSIALLLGGAHPPEAPSSGDASADDEYEDLSPEELDEHGQAAAEEFAKATKMGDAEGIWSAFETMHSLACAKDEHGEDEDEEKEEKEPEEKEDEPEEEDEEEK